nr:hypothetical protein [Clostridioides difficile]
MDSCHISHPFTFHIVNLKPAVKIRDEASSALFTFHIVNLKLSIEAATNALS